MTIADILGSTAAFAGLVWLLNALLALAGRKLSASGVPGILLRALNEVATAVKEVDQTYVEDIKRAKEDGKLSPEEAAQAKRDAVDLAKSYIGVKGLKSLARILGLSDDALDKWLGGKVEATVSDLRSGPQ